MMDLKNILQNAQELLNREIIPLEDKFLQGGWAAVESDLDEVRQKVKKAGLWLPQISKDYGGIGLSVAEFGEVSAVLGTTPLDIIVSIVRLLMLATWKSSLNMELKNKKRII